MFDYSSLDEIISSNAHNYQSQYTVTVDRTKLSKAFSSWSNLEIYITGIIQAAYNSAELDEYVNMKQVFARAVKANAIKQVTVPNPFKSKENAEEFFRLCRCLLLNLCKR